jgi:DNA-binding NtrC family response regulator
MNKDYKILVVDDNENFRKTVKRYIENAGFISRAVGSGEKALEILKDESFDIILLDKEMSPGMDGLEVLKIVKKKYPSIYVIMLTSYGQYKKEAFEIKADDYIHDITRCDRGELIKRIKTGIKEIERKREVGGSPLPYNISPSMKKILKDIWDYIPTDVIILFQGERGVGKTVLARIIHQMSPREAEPFEEINCAAIPEGLIEPELFGSVKGAYTGAIEDKPGVFELANKGTLFLDEIGNMGLAAQQKILKAIEEKKIRRVGGTSDIHVNVRLIVATNRNLKEEVRNRKFLSDLYDRIDRGITVNLPSLQGQKEDILFFIKLFRQKYADKYNKPISKIAKEAEELLLEYDYPGNVRELDGIIEKAVIKEKGDIIRPSTIYQLLYSKKEVYEADEYNKEQKTKKDKMKINKSFLRLPPLPENIDYKNLQDKDKEKYLLRALIENNGIKVNVAKALGVDRLTVDNHINKFEIRKKILIALINCQGEYQHLAEIWGVTEYQDRLKKCIEHLKIKELLKQTIKDNDNNISQTAIVLKVSPQDLESCMEKLGIDIFTHGFNPEIGK